MVEGVELIIDDADGILLAAMKVGFLLCQRGNLGIDGDNGVGKLEHAGEGVHKAVAANEDVAAGAGLIPAVAVATKKDGGAGGVVEKVVLYHSAPRRTEKCSASTVVADGVAGKVHLGSPRQVLDAGGHQQTE